MKGIISKTYTGWKVIYVYPEGTRFLPLHPDDVNQIVEDSKVFDNIEARIKAYPEVDFEIVVNEGEPLGKGEQPYKQYAKLTPFISNNIQIGSEGVYEHANSDALKK